MIEWINFIVILIFASLSAYYYVKGNSQTQLSKKIGPIAYEKCAQYRIISLVFFVLIFVCYIIYYFYPLPVPLPQTFPINYWILVVIALLMLAPCVYVYYIANRDAGRESMYPSEEGKLFGGIYTKIRHPQGAALLPLGWIAGLLLNSPFLVLLSFIWIPVFYLMCLAEEKDLILHFGDTYIDYMKRSWFWLPKIF